ncbi:MAG TPA: cytochrome D1 domain-containing protein [Terriglobales bacterium]|jgi:YVTN family beta-propeller protein|nr:cytochrome D1 domain-containing protein [Terriglobales bacterium]
MRSGVSSRVLIFLGSFLALGSPALVVSQSPKLYVTNSGSDDITVIDLKLLKPTGAIKVGAHVHGIAVQADGKKLFTTVESDNTLKIIDTANDKTVSTVKLTGRPNQCAVTPDGKYVAVPIRDGNSVDIVDVGQLKIVKVLPVSKPHNSFNAGSNRYIFVSSMGDEEINAIDLEKMEYSAHIPVRGVPRPFVVSSDGKTMYVALSHLHGFVEVDIPKNKVIKRVEIPAEHPHPKERALEPSEVLTHGLALSPDQTELWVTSLLDDSVYIYDVRASKVTGRLATGDGPNWVAFSPDGKYVCVSNADSDDVSIFDLKSRRELARPKVGKAPKRLVVED